MHDYSAILRHILAGYSLSPHGPHGVLHWARVHENGVKVAEAAGADVEVVRLFSLFHDSRRWNDGYDPQHGRRGGELARSLRGELVHLDDRQFDLLYEACLLHTEGHTTGDVTVQAGWDADRLDLGRVGVQPMPHLLCTDAARQLIRWSDRQALANHMPVEVLNSWGLDIPSDHTRLIKV